MADSAAQSLVNGFLNLAQATPEQKERFAAPAADSGATAASRSDTIVKLLDVIARMPGEFKFADIPSPKVTEVIKGLYNSRTKTTTLNSTAADLETLLHEGVHSLQNSAFLPALTAKAKPGSALEKFQAAYHTLYSKYDAGRNAVDPADTDTVYKMSPMERMAFGTQRLDPKFPQTAATEDRNSAALYDLMNLVELLPEEYKKTPKQLSRNY